MKRWPEYKLRSSPPITHFCVKSGYHNGVSCKYACGKSGINGSRKLHLVTCAFCIKMIAHAMKKDLGPTSGKEHK